MKSSKKELRLQYKALRKYLASSDIEEKSLAIANNVLKLPIWQQTYFHVFLPIEELTEVDTQYLLHVFSGKDKEIVVSKTDFETHKMIHYLLTDNTRIKKNQYNIPEPVDGIEVPPSKINVVIVPLLAFDRKGNRVGYGKGFYDQFLCECSPEVIKIGVSFFEAEDCIEDVNQFDITLDYCVTPNQIYTF